MSQRDLCGLLRASLPEEAWAPPFAAVAWSGGADSTALLLLYLEALRQEHGPRLPAPVTALHVDHRLRPDSHRDAAFCQDMARPLPVRLLRLELAEGPALAASPQTSLEAPARRGRYRELGLAMERAGLKHLLTAHHAEDNLETLLLALLRGAGLTGVAGIRPRISLRHLNERPDHQHLQVWRPLLEARRHELRAWLLARGASWREDPSNALLDRRRNQLRHQVLPLLGQIGDGLEPALRAPALLQRDRRGLEAAAEASLEQTRHAPWPGDRPHTVALDRDGLRRQPWLLPHVLRAAMRRAQVAYLPGQRHTDQLCQVVLDAHSQPRKLEMPGLCAEVHARTVRLWCSQEPAPQAPAPRLWSLEEPLRWGQMELRAWKGSPGEALKTKRNRWPALADTIAVEMFSWAEVATPLRVRASHPKERIPTWEGDSRRVRRLLESCGVPTSTRPWWPLVEDARGRALWLAPLRRGQAAPVQEHHDAEVLCLEWRWAPL